MLNMAIKGYEGKTHEIGLGWSASDYNGRGGMVTEITRMLDTEDYVITVRMKEGMEIVLKGSEISFTYPPEDDNAGN